MKLFKKRKKGSIVLEFLIAIPVIYFAAWVCMFIIMYSSAQNTVHQAAIEGARILTQELRGSTGSIPTDDDELKQLLRNKVKNSVQHFNYILLFHDEKGNAIEPEIIIEPSGGCQSVISAKKSVICAYTEKGTSSGIEQQQIVVYIKSKFYVIANVIPGIKDNTYASGKGSSEKEISGRFRYWN